MSDSSDSEGGRDEFGRDTRERKKYQREAERDRQQRLMALSESAAPSKEDLGRWRQEGLQQWWEPGARSPPAAVFLLGNA